MNQPPEQKSTIVDFFPKTETQARPLASLEPEEQVEAWKRVITSTPEGKITAAILLKFLIIYKVPQLGNFYLPTRAKPARLSPY